MNILNSPGLTWTLAITLLIGIVVLIIVGIASGRKPKSERGKGGDGSAPAPAPPPPSDKKEEEKDDKKKEEKKDEKKKGEKKGSGCFLVIIAILLGICALGIWRLGMLHNNPTRPAPVAKPAESSSDPYGEREGWKRHVFNLEKDQKTRLMDVARRPAEWHILEGYNIEIHFYMDDDRTKVAIAKQAGEEDEFYFENSDGSQTSPADIERIRLNPRFIQFKALDPGVTTIVFYYKK